MQYLFVILLFFAMFAWGVSWPLSKILSNAHSVFGIAFMRFFLVALCITPILFYSKISIKIPKDKILTIMLNIAFNASYSLLFFYALRFGNAGSAGVITTTLAPIIATFLSVLIFKNKLIKREIIGLLIGLISGFFLLNLTSIESLLNPFNIFFVICSLLWACVTLSAKKLGILNPLVINFYSSFCSAILFMPFLETKDLLILQDMKSMIILIIVVLFSTVFGTTIYYKGIKVLGITKSASFTLLVPFFALISSGIILKEIPSLHTIIGGILAVCAIYLISIFNKKHFAFLAKLKITK